jgi:hypothetical protein
MRVSAATPALSRYPNCFEALALFALLSRTGILLCLLILPTMYLSSIPEPSRTIRCSVCRTGRALHANRRIGRDGILASAGKPGDRWVGFRKKAGREESPDTVVFAPALEDASLLAHSASDQRATRLVTPGG